MLSISKALNSGQAQTYHQMEFTSSTQSYYKQDGAGSGGVARAACTQDGPVRCGYGRGVYPDHERPASPDRRPDGEASDSPGVQESRWSDD